MNKSKQEYTMIKKRETLAPRKVYGPNEHPINIRKYPIYKRANIGRQKATQ